MKKAVIPLSVFCLLILAIFARADGQPPFSQDELDAFIVDSPAFLDWCEHHGKTCFVIDIIMEPEKRLQHADMVDFTVGRGWNPDRFFYIFKQVILAGIMKDMGGRGERKLKMLLEKRQKIHENPNLPKDEKEKAIKQMDGLIEELKRNMGNFHGVHMCELLSMYNRRDVLERNLIGRLPIKKKAAPNY